MKVLVMTDAVLVSKLLTEIQDRSLQNILRKVIFSSDAYSDLEKIIKEERPELKQEDIDNLKFGISK